MNPLYNLGIQGLRLGARLGAVRSDKLKKQLEGQKETLGQIRAALARRGREGFDYWFHAASLGEFEQARPLIEAIRKKNPEACILLTFFSPSGFEVRKDYTAADCVAYLPFDTPSAARAFVRAARPACAVFIKYEFWGNFLQALFENDVPLYLVSAVFRPGQIFFKPWGGAFRRMLGYYTHIFVQDESSRLLLENIGFRNVTVAGDTRLDRVSQIAAEARPIENLRRWLEPGPDSSRPFTLAVGSSWQPDEACYIPWLNAHPQVKAIIAPHEFDAERLAAMQKSLKGRSVLWSEVDDSEIPADAQTVIIDCFGLLSRLYAYCDGAIVGGGLGAGIHNINEAAVYGIPVAFGPNHGKFQEAHALKAAGAASVYNKREECEKILDRWLEDAAYRSRAGATARAYIVANTGATDKVLKFIVK